MNLLEEARKRGKQAKKVLLVKDKARANLEKLATKKLKGMFDRVHASLLSLEGGKVPGGSLTVEAKPLESIQVFQKDTEILGVTTYAGVKDGLIYASMEFRGVREFRPGKFVGCFKYKGDFFEITDPKDVDETLNVLADYFSWWFQ